MLNEDYRDILRALSGARAKYVVVGAYAMAAHGLVRATMDIDIWVLPSPENARAVVQAIQDFGAPLRDLTHEDLLKDNTVFQIGVAPRRIDILTGVSGLTFDDAFANAVVVDIEGLSVRTLSLDDLITNKRASGRPRDLVDARDLELLRESTAGA